MDGVLALLAAIVGGLASGGVAPYIDHPRLAPAGLHVIAPLPGPAPDAAFLARVRRGELGGVIVYSSSFSSRRGLVRSLRAVRRAARAGGLPAPLVLVDQEGGSVRRLPWAAPRASAAELATRGVDAVHRAGRAAGVDLRAVGIQVDLAPVADVGWPGSFLDSRAFGTSATAVAPHVVAFARGLDEGGAAAALKHFPGLGRAGTSTDGGPVVIDATRRQLARDLVPFRAGVDAGAGLVMVASAIYPALDPDRPAVISRRILGSLLRADLGFAGVVVTDALDTPALAGVAEIERAAVLAGADLLLYSSAGAAAAGARRLEAAARAPEVRRRLARSDGRLAALRARLGM